MTESYFNSENSAHSGCLLLLCFKALTHVHHVTSVVKNGHLAVVAHLGEGDMYSSFVVLQL